MAEARAAEDLALEAALDLAAQEREQLEDNDLQWALRETVHATYSDSLGVTNWESAHVTFDRDGRVPYIEGQSIEVIAPGPDNWDSQRLFLFKILRAHVLPLTNCPYTPPHVLPLITGSYDRTCRVGDTLTGEKRLTLKGHHNVVYAIAFNDRFGFGDKIITGSFDMSAKIWDAHTGACLHTLRGHQTEIVCVAFNPQGTHVATGSIDNTARLWDVGYQPALSSELSL